MINDNINFDDPTSKTEGASALLSEGSDLASDIMEKYYQAKASRRSHEDRWATAYHNYRGKYYKNFRFGEHEKSRLFIKITKTKVVAGFGKIEDILFGNGTFPISVRETPVPEGIPEYVNTAEPEVAPEEDPFDVGFAGDGKVLKKGAKFGDLFDVNIPEDRELSVGVDLTGQHVTYNLAKIKAANADKLIKDQIEASHGRQHLRKALFEMCLFGTGIVKGPFTSYKRHNKWVKDDQGVRVFTPEIKKTPVIESVSIWNFYPDPNAFSIEDAEWTIQKHVLNRIEMRSLSKRPLFNKFIINKILRGEPNHITSDFDNEIRSEDMQNPGATNKWDVYEYWGLVKADIAKRAGLDVDNLDDDVQVNAWVCDNEIIRVVVNPFTPSRIPYLVVPYEENPYSIFGVGIAENMEDSQAGMNGHARMAVDNLALAGNLVFDIDESALAPGQDMSIYPGKKFVRNSGTAGQAIYGVKFPSTAPENMQMFDRFRQLADEATGIQSYSHGYTGVTGMTRTASGMSMLMGASALSDKTVVRNIDVYLLEPLGEAFYQWNMQFYDGELDIDGDFEVVALGTTSVMQKEVRSQRIQMFMQVAANPLIAPMVKWETLLKEFAKTLDFDPIEFIASKEDAKAYAEIVGMQNMAGAAPMTPPGLPGAPPMDPGMTGNGGGTIGTGTAPLPGEMPQ